EVKKVKNHVAIDADAIGKEIGARPNMIILGAASPYLEIGFDALEQAVRDIFGSKGEEVVNSNLEALRTGRKFAEGK
ncbi:2-oxoacid:acceptor oxidoreductase family protein, partial [Bacteroidales bacterium OttesenSCG-928-C19]|nr:2-oxoacid:acceptor oxidoreductase family protein [Bacteroidales bacterium OttesenSCG-928-C19]